MALAKAADGTLIPRKGVTRMEYIILLIILLVLLDRLFRE
jgi:hypothetical protein